MNESHDLVDRYIASWNETDATRRQALVAKTWTEGATYLDPLAESRGHDAIAAMIQAVQAQFPGLRFRRAGSVDTYRDRIRFSWELAPEGGEAVAKGTDFGVIAADSRLAAVTGFLDQVPA